MDKQRMIFEIDRRSVTEGDIVEINWQCEGAEEVRLTIDNGFRSTDMPLEISGSKRFRLNRSKGSTRLTLTVKVDGREHRKTIRVRVKKMPTVKADTVDGNGKKMGPLRRWWQRSMPKWHASQSRLKMAMNTLPKDKQLILKLMALLGVLLILGAIWPKVYNFTVLILIIYLVFVLVKR